MSLSFVNLQRHPPPFLWDSWFLWMAIQRTRQTKRQKLCLRVKVARGTSLIQTQWRTIREVERYSYRITSSKFLIEHIQRANTVWTVHRLFILILQCLIWIMLFAHVCVYIRESEREREEEPDRQINREADQKHCEGMRETHQPAIKPWKFT